MEKLLIKSNGQWELETLEKGAARKIAPRPNPREVENVGGGSASNYYPLDDESHRKRARMMLLKDMYNQDPKRVKTIDGTPHVLLHRGLNDSNWHPDKMTDTHVVHNDTRISDGREWMGGSAYTTQHNWAEDHGTPISIWVPIDSVHNYSDYAYKMAAQSKFRNRHQDVTAAGYDRDEVPLEQDPKTKKVTFREDVHAFVGPGKFLKATPEEVQATKPKEVQSKPFDRDFDLKIRERENK